MLYSSIALALAGSAIAAPQAANVLAAKSSGSSYTVPGYYKQSPPTGQADGKAFKFPLNNNFPNPSQANTLKIQAAAGGSLPNGPSPSSLSTDSIINFRLIAFNELFEVAFFTQLLQNINKGGSKYNPTGSQGLAPDDLAVVKQSLQAIQAQEEEHALAANSVLAAVDADGLGAIKPCEYVFPSTVKDLGSSLAFASQFTSLVLGALQDVNNHFAKSGDFAPIQTISSVLGEEGEQNGFFRAVIGYRPSPQPFKTFASRDLAFSVLQQFVKPDSCPQNVTDFGLTIFPALDVPEQPTDKSASVTFRIVNYNATSTEDISNYQVVYINGQNAPIVQDILNPRRSTAKNVKFEAAWPTTQTAPLFGLTIALVTPKQEFASAEAAINATVWGPGVIFVN